MSSPLKCIPPLTVHSNYCLLQDNFEALKWHIEQLNQAFASGPQTVLAESQHYQELYQRIIEATHLVQDIKEGNLEKLVP